MPTAATDVNARPPDQESDWQTRRCARLIREAGLWRWGGR